MRVRIRTVRKPWGREVWFTDTARYLGKMLHINSRCQLSRQYHRHKHETLYCRQGACRVEINGRRLILRPGQSISVPPGTRHRLGAGAVEVVLIEVSTPHPKDVVRLDDDYGRVRRTRRGSLRH